MSNTLLVLFDGNAVIHRAFHALPPLTVPKTGELVNAVYGFTTMLLKVISDLKPTHYAIAFDMKAPTFRHKLFEEYKAQRPKAPEDLVNQFARVRDIVKAFRIPIFELEGYEADDILGTLSKQASEQGIDTVIVTGDADAMQLVGERVKVLYPKPGHTFGDTMLFDEAAVTAKYGVGPDRMVDYKALIGDPSDNIPGVPGVGEKTAVKLIQQFGVLEEIYGHLDAVTPPRIQSLLRENEARARQGKVLATIVTSVPVTLNLDDCRISQYDRNRVIELFRELEFTSIINRLPGVEAQSAPVETSARPVQGDYRIVNTAAVLEELGKRLWEAGLFAFDTETTGLNPMTAELVGVSFSAAAGEAYYIPVGHTGLDEVAQLPLPQVIEWLAPLLGSAKPKLAHNGKNDMTVLAGRGAYVNELTFDTMVAAYLLGEKSLDLRSLAFARLNVEMTPITALTGTGAKQMPLSRVEIKRVADYACAEADITFQLASLLDKELHEQGLWQLFADVEMPLVPVLLKMEQNGVVLDRAPLAEMSRQLGEQLRKLELDIYREAKHDFNINSTQQLGVILFDEMQLPNERKGKNRYSTEAAVLEALRPVHPIIGLILEYRQLSKIKSTYIDALPALINPRTGRVHTSFNQTRTATGRLSSTDPNLQNIPIRGELGRQVRRAFIVPEGCRLVAGDYSQIDLRVLAHLSQDPRLLEAFRKDEDIHAATAAQLFGVETSQVKPDMRRLAKTVNFGVIYGMSEYGLEQATELSREEAGKFITAYFEKYPKVREYLDGTKEQARRTGYVQTILGRKRHLPEINASNRIVREAAERMAINMPVQGTSADIIKVAMVKLDREMIKQKLASKMLLQVHDELLFEVPEAELDIITRLVPQVMCSAIELSVPVKVDVKAGNNWGEME